MTTMTMGPLTNESALQVLAATALTGLVFSATNAYRDATPSHP